MVYISNSGALLLADHGNVENKNNSQDSVAFEAISHWVFLVTFFYSFLSTGMTILLSFGIKS